MPNLACAVIPTVARLVFTTPAQAAAAGQWQSATRSPNACIRVAGLEPKAPATGSMQHYQVTIRNDCGEKMMYQVVPRSGKAWSPTPIRRGKQVVEFCMGESKAGAACQGFKDVLFRSAE